VLFFKVALLTKSSMALHQSDSIILKTYPLGEADRIVAFLAAILESFEALPMAPGR
jgi:hypothetical protein